MMHIFGITAQRNYSSPWRRCARCPGRRLRRKRIGSGEGALPGDVAADEERLDLRGALVGEKGFHVAHVADHVEVQQDAVTAEDVAGHPAHVPGLTVEKYLAREALVSLIWPSSSSRPRRMQYSCMAVTSPSISTSIDWISWFFAIGRPNCLRRWA